MTYGVKLAENVIFVLFVSVIGADWLISLSVTRDSHTGWRKSIDYVHWKKRLLVVVFVRRKILFLRCFVVAGWFFVMFAGDDAIKKLYFIYIAMIICL